MTSPSNTFRRDLHGLRGIGILCVVVYHVGFPHYFCWIAPALDIFFMLSGMLGAGKEGPSRFELILRDYFNFEQGFGPLL